MHARARTRIAYYRTHVRTIVKPLIDAEKLLHVLVAAMSDRNLKERV